MKNDINKNHWDELAGNYSKTWKGYGKNEMNKREMEFIAKYLKKSNQNLLLDLGVGNGRILETLFENTKMNSEIYGLDVSSKMVAICKEKFKNIQKIKKLNTCDIANEAFPFNKNFDFITAIRVLKYNKNWREIINKIYKELNHDGIFVFTMVNSISINRFFKYKIPIYRTNIIELRRILLEYRFKILEIRSFTKLPDFFYDNSKNEFFAKIVIFLEELLETIFGKIFLGRILFIAVKKDE